MTTGEKRIKLLHDLVDLLLKCTEPSQKNQKPGFPLLLNPGFGLGKMAGFPRGPGFSKPGFQSLHASLQGCKAIPASGTTAAAIE